MELGVLAGTFVASLQPFLIQCAWHTSFTTGLQTCMGNPFLSGAKAMEPVIIDPQCLSAVCPTNVCCVSVWCFGFVIYL